MTKEINIVGNKISLSDAQNVVYALGSVIDYLTDNSCSDPECCGGPWVSREDFEAARSLLMSYDITVES